MKKHEVVSSNATFSPCGKYRYSLERWWYDSEPAVFIGLNPSTADATKDDATIRRCIRFARAWGCGGLVMLNLFAFRATNPKAMKAERHPVGPDNDRWIKSRNGTAKVIVAAWGVHGSFQGRDVHVCRMISGMKCLGVTKDGCPRHPLYLRADTPLIDFKLNG